MGRRVRHRGGSNNGGGNRRPNQNHKNRVYDSNGPDVRIRGTAFQITEKYMALAKDAASSGDRVLAESYLQHAEHYQRVINTWMEAEAASAAEYDDANDAEDTEVAEEEVYVFQRNAVAQPGAEQPQMVDA